MVALTLSRVIVFTGAMDPMRRFYGDVLGLPLVRDEDGWVEFGAGSATVALHQWQGEAPEGPVKIVFHAADVAAARAELVARGAAFGEIVNFREIGLFDGSDPDGNAIQLSSRPPIRR